MFGEKLLIRTDLLSEEKRLETIQAIVSVLERTNVSYEWRKKDEEKEEKRSDCKMCGKELEDTSEDVCVECFRSN